MPLLTKEKLEELLTPHQPSTLMKVWQWLVKAPSSNIDEISLFVSQERTKPKRKNQFSPIFLTKKEQINLQSCGNIITVSCEQLSNKILHIKPENSCAQNKKIRRELQLFWHPDRKNNDYSLSFRQKQMVQINIATEYQKTMHKC